MHIKHALRYVEAGGTDNTSHIVLKNMARNIKYMPMPGRLPIYDEKRYCMDSGARNPGDFVPGLKAVLNGCQSDFDPQKFTLSPFGDDQR
jgi:hypothetical protein